MFVSSCKQDRRCSKILILIYVAAASARCGNSKPFRKSEILMTFFLPPRTLLNSSDHVFQSFLKPFMAETGKTTTHTACLSASLTATKKLLPCTLFIHRRSARGPFSLLNGLLGDFLFSRQSQAKSIEGAILSAVSDFAFRTLLCVSGTETKS